MKFYSEELYSQMREAFNADGIVEILGKKFTIMSLSRTFEGNISYGVELVEVPYDS